MGGGGGKEGERKGLERDGRHIFTVDCEDGFTVYTCVKTYQIAHFNLRHCTPAQVTAARRHLENKQTKNKTKKTQPLLPVYYVAEGNKTYMLN